MKNVSKIVNELVLFLRCTAIIHDAPDHLSIGVVLKWGMEYFWTV